MFKNPKVTLVIIMALILGAIVAVINRPPTLGLDLQGGTRLTLEAVPTTDVPRVTPQVMDSLQFVVENRVNKMGIAESVVQRAGDRRLLVEIPGIKDPEAAKRMLGRVGNLEFRRLVEGEWTNTGISGKDLASAAPQVNPATGEWYIEFTLNAQASQAFGDMTLEMYPTKEPLAIFFDGELISAPQVQSAILDGSGSITGSFTRETAKELVDTLNAGALPVNIEVIEESTVGPLLGQASIKSSLWAGLAGLGLVLVFMVAYYRLPGLVANGALVVYTLLTFAAYLLVGVTFTLAGIAGFILSIGMAVDANILIFERTKEEIRNGRSLWKAIEVGFDRAFPSIFDSNSTTLITCFLLWVLGTGAVKGFALTLAIGVLISLFSAITVSRTFLLLVTTSGGQAVNPSMYGVKPAEIQQQKAHNQEAVASRV